MTLSHQQHADDRIDLAAIFRMSARLNLHEAVSNHFSYAVSDDGKTFLINPNGRHFSLIKASDLLLLNADDTETTNHPDAPDADAPDATAWAIHSAMHQRKPDARCVLHVHSKYTTVLASLADKTLPPIDQNSCRFYERVAIDEHFDGMGLGDEAKRYPTLLTDKSILLLGNHGLLVTAPTIALAFDELYFFERACETYITALATGKPLSVIPPEVARKTAQQWLDYNRHNGQFARLFLRECKQILDREEPDYAH